MKRCISIILLFSFTTLYGQQEVKQLLITGLVIDSATNKGLPAATVSLYIKNKLSLQTTTDSNGKFIIETSATGNCFISITMISYKSFQTAVFVLRGDEAVIDYDTIAMAKAPMNLKTITIRGQKPLIEQRIDGIVFNAENLSTIPGSNATDVLRNVPIVNVSPDGGISIRGSSNIKVFIDGKPSDIYASSVADALKAIPGENIAKIEVITHPSAKYDAEGTDAVINIITKKPKGDGTNGNISLIAANRTADMMGDMHSKYKKWFFNADVYYQKFRNKNGNTLERTSSMQHYLQKNESTQTGEYFYGGVNIMYNADSLNTFNVGYRSRFSSSITLNNSENAEVIEEIATPSFTRDTRTPVNLAGNTFSLGYTTTSRNKKKELSISGIYFLSQSGNGYSLRQQKAGSDNDYLEKFGSIGSNRDFIVQADYTHTINERWKWETGIKANGKSLKSDNLFDIYDPVTNAYVSDSVRSNSFNYRNTIYAAYGNMTMKLKKWGISAGLRYERTVLDAFFNKVKLRLDPFNNVVPQLLVNRMFSEKRSLQLGYTVKLARPYISYLNPTINNSDSLTIQSGNPLLQPEITKRYQVNYTVNDPKLFKDVALFFYDNSNSIETVREPLDDGRIKSTWRNIGSNRRLGITASFTWKPSQIFNIGVTYTGQYVWLKSSSMQLSSDGMVQQYVIRSNFTLPKNYSIYLYGFFGSRSLGLQGYRTGWKYYSLSFTKKWKSDRFSLNLRGDAFFTPYTWIMEEIDTGPLHQVQRTRYQNQYVRLTFSWKIGKKDIKAAQPRQSDNAD